MEKIREILDKLSTSSLVYLWNMLAEETNFESIYFNDDYFFSMMYGDKPMEAVRAAMYGEYEYQDDYVYINAYGNLSSFNYADEDTSPINFGVLADWCSENLENDDVRVYLEEYLED